MHLERRKASSGYTRIFALISDPVIWPKTDKPFSSIPHWIFQPHENMIFCPTQMRAASRRRCIRERIKNFRVNNCWICIVDGLSCSLDRGECNDIIFMEIDQQHPSQILSDVWKKFTAHFSALQPLHLRARRLRLHIAPVWHKRYRIESNSLECV